MKSEQAGRGAGATSGFAASGRSGRMRQAHQLAVVEGGAGSNRAMRDEIAGVCEQVLGRTVVISDETDIIEDLGMDSLAVMNFVMGIEDHYDLSIPLDRVAEIRTVADLMRAVQDLRTGGPA